MPGETQERSHHHRKQSMTCVAPALFRWPQNTSTVARISTKKFSQLLRRATLRPVSAPAERGAGPASTVVEAPGTDWPQAVPRPTGGRRGQSRRAPGACTAGPAERVRKGVSEDDPPCAFLEKLDSALAPSAHGIHPAARRSPNILE